MILRAVAVLWILTLAPLAAARAQPEIVPSDHPVYEFLHVQRVRGRLPEYRHELLPLSRSQVLRLLDSLRVRTPAGARAPGYWLREYRREFEEPEDQIERALGDGRVRIPRGRDTEKFLYHRRTPEARFAVSGTGGLQLRSADDTLSSAGLALLPVLEVSGQYRNLIGFYSSTFNGIQITGDTRVLRSDPDLASLYYVGRAEEPPGSFDRSTASLRAEGGPFFAEIAHAHPVAGARFGDPILLSGLADHFSHVRLGLDTRRVQYQFLHGALGDRARQVRPDPESEQAILVGPERYLAMHRVELHPGSRLGLAFTEAVVYGLRGPELAYLNPVNPIKTAEHALWDRDNTLFALEAVLRPVDGVEAYVSWLADDLDFALIGERSYFNKWAMQAGVGAALGGGVLAWAEYTRIEPFVYTHRFLAEGSFYNAYQHNGYSLGHPIGPNADQWAAGVRAFLPLRLYLEAGLRYVRRGENFVAQDGTPVNVGGDLLEGQLPDYRAFVKEFLGGDRFEGAGARAALTWQPIREYILRFYADAQRWDRDADRLFVRGEFLIAL